MVTLTAPSATLTPCQAKALDVLERQGNVFLTGAAGTGKSFLLQHYLANKPAEHFPIVASTGAAAVLVGGRTFHSFFGLGILEGGIEAAISRALKSGKVINRLSRASAVIIDEISMLSGTTLQAAEAVAREARKSNEPWGGLRIIAVGDFAQLPPITPGMQTKDWAFLHPVWALSDFQPALLTTVMRTQDQEFLQILNYIREGVVNEEVCAFLDHRQAIEGDELTGTRLYPHRAQAEAFNMQRIQELPGVMYSFETEYVGKDLYIESAKKSVPIPGTLLLKIGALVMMRKNDSTGGMLYVNGSLGEVQDITSDLLKVRLFSGDSIEVEREKFSYLDGEGNEVVAAWNFPVTLAWGTTIHKAQGASFDRMIIDIQRLWEPGQAYVALSRVRSGDGLHIERWSREAIKAEPLVTDFYNKLADQALRYVPRPFYSVPLSNTPKKVKKAPAQARANRAKLILKSVQKQVPLADIASQCDIKPDRVVHYIEEFLVSGTQLDVEYLVRHIPNWQHIKQAFEECGYNFLKPVYEELGGKVSYDDLRLVRCVYSAEKLRTSSAKSAVV